MSANSLAPDGTLRAQLFSLLQSIELAGRAILPSSHETLLQSIVEAAARIFGAAAASIALVNEEEQVLQFVAAYGAGERQVGGMRIPLDKGIAGCVALTGQPMAISDVQRDPNFYQEFARSTGYVPRSILAAPLISDDRVIGVMEVLDKIDAPSFGLEDMDLLGMFARQAALAISQSQQVSRIGAALVLGLERLSQAGCSGESTELVESLRQARATMATAQDVLALADMFGQVSALGEAERRMCLDVISAFARYGRVRLPR